MRQILLVIIALFSLFKAANAQQHPLVFNTIERPPFAFQENGQPTGFSIDLMSVLARTLEREVTFNFRGSFPEMLGDVESGAVDGAIANISITAAREAVLDFTQPFFESGLQIMVSGISGQPSVWRALFSYDLFFAVLAAFAILFVLGLLMWVFERRKQPYFDRPMDQALFPSFWWALNLVVNGGFEERQPQSAMGRLLSVLMVVSSLFIVSIFVANITASLTVDAITGSIENLDDLNGRKVGTTVGSTSSALLDSREISHRTYDSFAELIRAFEEERIEAVVFDGPLLAFYVNNDGLGEARLIDRVFRPENYGIALPQGSPLQEPINRALLSLTETGAYRDLVKKWFGQQG